MKILVIDNVFAAYPNSAEILKGVSLSLSRGEQIAIWGRNGEGKSTFLKIAAGILKPSRGTVRISVDSNPALLLQNPRQQLVCATVLEEIVYTLKLNGYDEETSMAIAGEQLSRFGLVHLADFPPLRLSGGQQQKVALAALLCRNPELLLLDEPDAFLDGASRAEFRTFFHEHVHSAAIWVVSRESEIPPGMRANRLSDGLLSDFRAGASC